jgi:cell division protein FtsI/penicillin-binding protein 2
MRGCSRSRNRRWTGGAAPSSRSTRGTATYSLRQHPGLRPEPVCHRHRRPDLQSPAAFPGQAPVQSRAERTISAGVDRETADRSRRARSREVRINTTTFCPGWFSLEGDSHRYRDWKEHGHGSTDLEKAIVESCDVYFYDLARTLGIDRIHDYLSLFNLGRVTGIDLRNESPGLLPSRDWKRVQRRQPWYPGETLITGIGQGYMLATPLQLAQATATLAMNGRVYLRTSSIQSSGRWTGIARPSPGTPRPPIEIVDAGNWLDIIESMRKTVHTVRGTAFGISRGAAYEMAGKTGTAQVFGIGQDEQYIKEDIAERLRDHALFVSFAPFDDPRIAIAVIIENGGSGATDRGAGRAPHHGLLPRMVDRA